jgi:hypothetical protein
MSKKEAPLTHLQHYLPPDTYDAVYHYLLHYKVHLTVARERKSILGDYRHRTSTQNHRISVNGNLNKYAFLITLLHELAHLFAFEQFGNRIAAHGREWKDVFGQLLKSFVERNVFPADIKRALQQSLTDPAASSCADESLLRVLRKYDERTTGHVFVEDIPEGGLFKTHDGKVFRKGAKMRKRFRCEEVATKKVYLFSPVYEAQAV